MGPLDQFDIWNDTDDPLPAGGLCQWAGGVTSAGAVKVVKPTAASAPNLIVCGPHGIAPRSAGLGTFAASVVVAFDPTAGTPAAGDALGSQIGSFLAKKGNTGFVCYAGAAGPWAQCARNEPREGAPNYLAPARVATTANVDVLGGGLIAGTVHDGVTLAVGDRVLVWTQTTTSRNGVYVVPASGAASRAADAATGEQLYGALVPVTNGSVHGDTLWMCAADSVPTVDSSALPFVKIGPADASHVRVRAVVSHKVVGGAQVDFTDSTTWASGVQNGSVWDGVTLATNDLILVNWGAGGGATTRAGIYRVQASGAPVRAAGFTSDNSMHGLTVSVSEGTVLRGSLFVCATGTAPNAFGADGTGRFFARVGRPWTGTVRFAYDLPDFGPLLAGASVDGATAAEGDRYISLYAGAAAGGVFVVQAAGYTGSRVSALDCPSEYLNRGALVRVTSGSTYGGTSYFNDGTTWQFVGPAVHSWQDNQTGSFLEVSSLGGVPRQTLQVADPLYLLDFSDLLLSGTGTRIACTPASSTTSGYVTLAAQEFAGAKTFLGAVQINGALSGLSSAQFSGNITSFGTIQTTTGQNIASGGIFRVGNGGALVDGYTGTPGPGFTTVGGLVVGGGSGSFVGTATSNAFTNTNSFSSTTTFTGAIASSGGANFTPASSSGVPVTAQGLSGQTGNLFEAKTDTGSVVASVSAAGVLTAAALNGTYDGGTF